MTNLSKEDCYWVWQRLPKIVKEAMKELGSKVFVAGGFVRACVAREEVNDIDLCFPDKDVAATLACKLECVGSTTIKTQNAITILRPGCKPIQIIHRWMFDDPCKCIESFDFTIAQAIVYIEKLPEDNFRLNGYRSNRFYEDLAAKRLVYTSPKRIEEVGGSMLRVLKFYQRGYRIPLESLGAVIARLVSGVDYEAVAKSATLESRTIEEQVAYVLAGLLREVDPNTDPSNVHFIPSQTEIEATT